MTETTTPAPTAFQLATEAIRELQGNRDGADPSQLAQAALAAATLRYTPPERPVEVRVTIEDEDGLCVEQTLSFTRAQGGVPEVLGSAVGHAVRSALTGFYVTSDGAEFGDAVAAAVDALDQS